MGRSCRCAACATAARPHAGGLRSTWPARTATRIPSCPPAASLAPPRRPWTAPATFISPALTSDPTAAGLTTRPAPTSTPDGLPEATTKQQVKTLFREGKDAKILLGTDSLSEGLNLQTCGKLINYDMPWNFMRVEQRIGRIERIGGKSLVQISNYFYKDT